MPESLAHLYTLEPLPVSGANAPGAESYEVSAVFRQPQLAKYKMNRSG
jgi:hypothetical protein